MNQRARLDCAAQLDAGEGEIQSWREIAATIGTVPTDDAPLTPGVQFRKPPGAR